MNIFSTLLRELENSGIPLPEIRLGMWNYSGGVEPLRAAIKCGARLIDTAESYETEEIIGEAIKGRRLGTDHFVLYQLQGPNLTKFPSKSRA